MTVAAKTAKGLKLYMGDAAGTTTLVAELIECDLPGFEADVLDVTTHDSPAAEEYIAEGTYKVPAISGKIHYIAGSPDDARMIAACTPPTLKYFKLQPKSATGTQDQVFAGFLIEYKPTGLGVKGKQEASFTIQPSGVVTRTPTV
jgi:hypothetical protein